MISSLLLILSVALIPFTLAQSNDAQLQIQAIEAHFKQSRVVPELLPTFDPVALLEANYLGVGDVAPGQLLTKEQSAPTPQVTVTPVNTSVPLTGKFTIMMVDADIVGADQSQGVNRHWLINGVGIENGRVSNTSATAITAYAGPGPAAGSGPHRYVIILYQQPDSFRAPPDLASPIGVTRFDLGAYVKNSGLGSLVAATYITVEDGTATASIPTTSAVISSTLVTPQLASTGTSKTSTGTASANSPSQTNAAATTLLLDFYPSVLAALVMIMFTV